MKDEELKKLLKKTGYPHADELFEIAQEHEDIGRMLGGLLVIKGKGLPHKLQVWVMDGNIGKVSALGQFIIFLRQKKNDEQYLIFWSDFEAQIYSKRKAVVLDALRWQQEHSEDSEFESTIDGIISEVEANNFPLMDLKNPSYLSFRTPRKLVEMLRKQGEESYCYYLERFLTEFCFMDEPIVWGERKTLT